MAGGDTIMDFFMQELGVPGSQLLLAAEQTFIHGVPISIHWHRTRADYRSYTSGNKS